MTEKTINPSGPLVSVIVPTRNRASILPRALESILNQAYDNVELIIVDDASDDDTSRVAKIYGERFLKFQYIQNEERQGGAEARNIGIKHSRGEYIAFLDDDDEWLAGKLSKQLELLSRDPEIGAVTCWYYKLGPRGRKKVQLVPDITSDLMLWENFLGSFSFCMVRSLIAKGISLDPGLTSGQDWQFWIMLSRTTKIASVQDYMVNYHDHGEVRISNTKQYVSTALRKHYFSNRDSMSRSCREYCRINILRYRILRSRRTIFQKCMRLIKAGVFITNRTGRFIIIRSLRVFLDTALGLNRYDPDRETYNFIKHI